MSGRKTHSQFLKEFYSICDSIEVLGKYQTTATPIRCRCKVCKHVWSPKPHKLLLGRGCPKCANKKRGIHINRDDFIEKLKMSNPIVELLGDYTGGHDFSEFKCTVCGNIWRAQPYSILAGHGCPICAHTATSFSEKFIANSLAYVLGQSAVQTRNKKLIGKE